MEIPSFVGPLASALLFLLTVFGFCFYYCYIKPRRQRKHDAEANGTVTNTTSPSSCPTGAARKYSYEEECCSGLSPYSAGYCFHGGFPIAATYYEQNWQRPRKYQGPAVVNVIKKPKMQCCEPRIDVINCKERCHGTVPKHLYVCRQASTDSHGSSRGSCHLQVIQECEEEKEEDEEVSEIDNKNSCEGCDVDNTPNTCNNTCTVTTWNC